MAWRFGARAGGVASAFPAIVGPVLLVGALDHGTGFAARAAAGTMLGLASLAAFAAAYARTAPSAGWRRSLAIGWAAAALTGGLAAALGDGVGAGVALAVAVVALAGAHRLIRPAAAAPSARLPRWELPARMAATAGLVVALAAAAGWLGPVAGGVLAALPVLASVLAAFTHARAGAAAAAELLRGMLAGMAGFVAFCLVVALAAEPAGIAVAFGLATLAAVAAHALALGLGGRRALPLGARAALARR